VNLEYLARVVFVHEEGGKRTAYPDTLVGTDSHTTMVNGLAYWGGVSAESKRRRPCWVSRSLC